MKDYCEILFGKAAAQTLHMSSLLTALEQMVPREQLHICEERLTEQADKFHSLSVQFEALQSNFTQLQLQQQVLCFVDWSWI